jgi:hypothetical protein
VFIVKEFKTMSERDREDLANFLKRIADELIFPQKNGHLD